MDDLQTIYEQYAKPVYRFLLSLCGDPDLAEELTAETFYRAVGSIHRYDGSCKLLTWLCQIAKHQWYHELRRRGKTAPPPDESLPGGPALEDTIVAKEEKIELYRRLRRLDPATREVMLLRLSGELSFREIGEIMEHTENWARVTYYRGKERMKRDE